MHELRRDPACTAVAGPRPADQPGLAGLREKPCRMGARDPVAARQHLGRDGADPDRRGGVLGRRRHVRDQVVQNAAAGIGTDEFRDAGGRPVPVAAGGQLSRKAGLRGVQQLGPGAGKCRAPAGVEPVERTQVDVEIAPDQPLAHLGRLDGALPAVGARERRDEAIAAHLHQEGVHGVAAGDAAVADRPHQIGGRDRRGGRITPVLEMQRDGDLAQHPALQVGDVMDLARQRQMGLEQIMGRRGQTVAETVHPHERVDRIGAGGGGQGHDGRSSGKFHRRRQGPARGAGGVSAPARGSDLRLGDQMPATDVAQDLAPRRRAQRVDRAWHLARKARQRRPLGPRVGHRHRRHQPPGIGVLRGAEDLRAGAHLDDLAHEHHRHPVRDVLDHRHVMADEEIGDAELALQCGKQVEHPRLHRDIQRRDALVGDDELRLQRKGAGDADPLALATRELVRIAVELIAVEADPLEQRGDAGASGLGRADAVDEKRLAHQIAHPHPRIKRRHRVLEHDLHVAAQRLHLARGQAAQPVARHLDAALMRHEPGQRLGDRRLAAAAFADEREGLAGADVEADALDRVDAVGDARQQPAADVEAHAEIAQPRDGVRLGGGGGGAAAVAHPRHRGQKVAGVGLLRRVEDLRDRAGLDHLALFHHDHPLGHLGHNAHVMGDEDDRGAHLALQIAQQVEHLALHGDVKRGGRLVGDQHVGAERQRHRDHHALAHAARQLVRELVEPALGFRDPHRLQRLKGAAAGLGARHRRMGADRLAKLAPDRQHRVERGHRLLEDHRDAVAANGPHPALGQAGQVLALKADRPGADAQRGRRQQPHDRERGQRLARAALAGDGDGLARRQGEAEIAHQRPLAPLGPDRDRQPLDRQHRAGRGIRGRHGPGPEFRCGAHSNTLRGK
ncbi:hypothetical protein SDC9_26375 [bioreactor metagenome]|uniref:Uncharacterized protein n=1 Tax=bioreactor metagenome TaxID=1076179 RepID=A0A644UNQ0_9ZZZZ